MDTISIKVHLNLFNLMLMEQDHASIFNRVRLDIDTLKSRFGHTFLTVTEFSPTEGFIMKVSYPRYYQGTNAFLISSREQCFEVQQAIINFFYQHKYLRHVLHINLIRVDIPFTYLMSDQQYFYQYANIYKVLAHVYQTKGYYAKFIGDTITNHHESLMYSSTKNSKDFHSKVQIYNQYLNLETKTKDSKEFSFITERFPDLSKRIRIEVCKKIKRESIPINQFGTFDIFGNYINEFKFYLLENLFDMNEIELLYEQLSDNVAADLLQARNYGGFTYENFMLHHLGIIYDYEIIKRAIYKTITSQSTREKAITSVRNFLRTHEFTQGNIVLNTYNILKHMRECISTSFIF